LKNDPKFLTSLLDASLDGILAFDHDCRYTAWNRAMERISGMKRADVLGKTAFDVFPFLKDSGEDKCFCDALAGKTTISENRPYTVPETGRAGFFEGHYSPLYGNSGEIVGGLCIIRDITDRRHADDVAQEAHQRLAFHVENTPLAVVEWDSDFRVSRWSESAERLFGWKADEVLAKHVADWRFVFAEDVNSVRQLTNNQRRGVERRGVLRNRNYTKDGKILHCEWYNSVLNDDAGKLVSVLSLVLDVTARKLAEEEAARFLVREREARREAENADRLKDEFLATLSHELRTPLTSVLGWATLIRQGDVDEANYAVAMETIERNARLQARLIDDLLDVSRIITGNLRLELRPIDLAPVVEAARDAVRPAAEAKGIQLQTTFDSQACTIKGDPNRLRQVVWNLLLNAIKFTPRDGRVAADLRCANSSVLLTVSDSGEGIEAEFLPHAFDRFRQAEGSISRRQGGLGLGLAVVRHLVELHGGSVSAKSPGKGMGATFTVELPLAAGSNAGGAGSAGVSPAETSETAQHQHASQDAKTRSRRGADAPKIDATEATDYAGQRATKLRTDNATQLTGVRVLVVEDDEDARALIGTMLERSGAVVISASSVTEALQAFDVASPDTPINVLVSDIGMAGEDGYDLVRKVRLLAPERGGLTPAIALTGYASRKDRAQAIEAGYQAHIAKPIEPGELVTAVARLVMSDED
jgi:PAS domain S-box-containing protein